MPSAFNSPIEALDALLDQMGRGATPVVASAVSTAPAAGAVVADSGQLAAGIYRVEVSMGFSGTVVAGKHVALEHRNAANSATLQTLKLVPSGSVSAFVFQRYVLAANERLRVITGVIALSGEVAHGSIIATPLPA